LIRDHITFIKDIVEGKLTRADGTKPFAGKFFELYPKAGRIIESAPCAALRHMPGTTESDGTFRRFEQTEGENIRYRQLYKIDATYQIDLYSRDIYDFYSDDGSDLLNQLVEAIAAVQNIVGASGNNIEVSLGTHGYFDDETLVIDNVYKAYCRISFGDGAYRKQTVTRLPSNFSISGEKQ
jgi:hypothetical protein